MDRFPETRREPARMGVLVALFGLVVWASYRHGAPVPLPDVALGWAFLLHLERAAAVLAVVGVVLLVGWRASRGDFPSRFGQIEYEAKGSAARADVAMTSLERRVELLEIRTVETGPDTGSPRPILRDDG